MQTRNTPSQAGSISRTDWVKAPQNPEVNARKAVSASSAPMANRQPAFKLVKKKIGAR